MASVLHSRGRTWPLYFTEDDEADGGCDTADLFGDSEDGAAAQGVAREAILSRIATFLRAHNIVRAAVSDPMDVISAQHTLHLSWASLTRVPQSATNAPAVRPPFDHGELTLSPQLVLDCLAYLAHEDLLTLCPAIGDTRHITARLAAKRLRVRIHETNDRSFLSTPMCDLKADKIGRLVSLQGSVIRASSLRPYVEAMCFVCPRCHTRSRRR